MLQVVEHKYSIGQKVYHVIGDNQIGIIIDMTYKFRENLTMYCVTFDVLSESLWYYEEELQESPNFN